MLMSQVQSVSVKLVIVSLLVTLEASSFKLPSIYTATL